MEGGNYYCEFCRNITFHDNQGRCENTENFGGELDGRRRVVSKE